MKTIFRLDPHTIDCILFPLCLLFFGSVLSCTGGYVLNKTSLGYISVRAEQEFWNDWLSKSNNSSCPLRPFVLSYTQSGIDEFEKRIKRLRGSDSAMLFIRINIDNGIYYYYYLAWNRGEHLANSLQWDSPNDSIKEENLNLSNLDALPLFDEMSKRSVLVHIEDRTLLDGDSMYLSLWYKGRYSRLASYNPKISRSKQVQSRLPFLLLDEIYGKK